MEIKIDAWSDGSQLGYALSQEDGWIEMDGHAITRLDASLLGLRCARLNDVTVAIGTGHQGSIGGRAILVNSKGVTRDLLEEVHGINATYIWHPPGVPYLEALWIQQLHNPPAVQGWRQMIDPGTLEDVQPRGAFAGEPAGSQGILDVTPQGVIFWTSYNGAGWIDVNGVILRSPLFRQGLVIGQHQDSNNILVYSYLTQNWWSVSSLGTDQNPRFAVSDKGEALAAISGHQGINLFPSDGWTPWAPPAEILPPVTDITPVNRPFVLGYYSFNDTKLDTANIVIPIRSTLKPVQATLVPSTVGPAPLFGDYIDEFFMPLEQQIDAERPKANQLGVSLWAFQDSNPTRGTVLQKLKDWDVLMPMLYRDKQDANWQEHFRQWAYQPGRQVCPVVGIHSRNGTLTRKDVAEVVIWCSQLAQEQQWFGVVYFRIGTSDEVDVRAYIAEQWRTVKGLPAKPKPPGQVNETKTAIALEVVNFDSGTISRGISGRRPVNAILGDETATLIQHTNGTVSLRSPNGHEYLSIERDGAISYRQVSDPNQPGPWETFLVVNTKLQEQPKNAQAPFWTTNDGKERKPVMIALVSV